MAKERIQIQKAPYKKFAFKRKKGRGVTADAGCNNRGFIGVVVAAVVITVSY